MDGEEMQAMIDDSELRTLLRLRYIDNLQWYQVAHRMNDLFEKKKNIYTQDSCRMKCQRFLEKD